VATALYVVRRRTMPDRPRSWWRLLVQVLLLMVVTDLVSILPVVGIAAIIIWLVGMKRLSGLDVLSTVLLSCTLGVFCFAAMLVLAQYFQVPVGGPHPGG